MMNVLSKREMNKKVLGLGLAIGLVIPFATGVSADELSDDQQDLNEMELMESEELELMDENSDVVKESTVDVIIETGTMGKGGLDLESSEIESFGTINLKGDPTTYNTSFTDTFTIKDLRGTQEGWNLSLSATPFTSEDVELPKGSLTLDGINQFERVGEGQGDLPEQQLIETSIIDDGSVAVLNAETGKGMGVFELGFDTDALGLTVDATTAKVGEYESTFTWNLQSTPQGE